jgi:hypothetical protein
MKSKEEIEKLAKNLYPISHNPQQIIEGFERVAFKKGYMQCQEDMANKKYTEEDIRKVIDETIKACNISQKESYGDLEIDTDKIINSLNKQD